jgi:hypothetical protein
MLPVLIGVVGGVSLLYLLWPALVKVAEQIGLIWRFCFGYGGETRRLAVLDFKLRALMTMAGLVARYERKKAAIEEERDLSPGDLFRSRGRVR